MVRSPHRKRLHVRTKKSTSTEKQDASQEGPMKMTVTAANHPPPSHVSLSLSLTPEIEKMRKDLAQVAILSLVEGFVNNSSILEVVPSILN